MRHHEVQTHQVLVAGGYLKMHALQKQGSKECSMFMLVFILAARAVRSRQCSHMCDSSYIALGQGNVGNVSDDVIPLHEITQVC